MISYAINNYDKMLDATLEHLIMVGLAMLLACMVTGVLVYVCYRSVWRKTFVMYLASIFYAIPSFAMFALLIPITGLGKTTAIIALVLYAQYILVRNCFTGLQEVDEAMVNAAYAMGMTDKQVLLKIQIPLAFPSFISGLRIAVTSSIGIASIAATINAGGLGVLIFDGLRKSNVGIILWGIILTGVLCLLANIILKQIEIYVGKHYGKMSSE